MPCNNTSNCIWNMRWCVPKTNLRSPWNALFFSISPFGTHLVLATPFLPSSRFSSVSLTAASYEKSRNKSKLFIFQYQSPQVCTYESQEFLKLIFINLWQGECFSCISCRNIWVIELSTQVLLPHNFENKFPSNGYFWNVVCGGTPFKPCL